MHHHISSLLPQPRIHDWYHKAKQSLPLLRQRAPEKYEELVREVDLDSLEKDLREVEERLRQLDSPVVFTHNDVSARVSCVDRQCRVHARLPRSHSNHPSKQSQYGNILIRPRDSAIIIIDYEYAGYNYRAFDIANHFCEWAADYHSSTPHVLHYRERYPTREQQMRFYEAYLNERDRFLRIRQSERGRRVDGEVMAGKLHEVQMHQHVFHGGNVVGLPAPAVMPSSNSTHRPHSPMGSPTLRPTSSGTGSRDTLNVDSSPVLYQISPRLRPQPSSSSSSRPQSPALPPIASTSNTSSSSTLHLKRPPIPPFPHPSPTLSPLLTPMQLRHLRQQELAHLANDVDHFVLASHLMWALWGVIQASNSIIDFDYVQYCVQRVREYRRWRKEVLGWDLTSA